MAAYFQYVNLDRKEVISLSSLWSIKAGAYTNWSLQTALLQLFLGGPEDSRFYNPPLLIGHWRAQRIAIECDEYGQQYDSDFWPDAGMAALAWMRTHTIQENKRSGNVGPIGPPRQVNLLDAWLTARDFGPSNEFFNLELDKWIEERKKENNPRPFLFGVLPAGT